MRASKGGEQSEMWSTHDLACSHCRARKIRCGRERPQCQGCKRDGVECSYSSPGRRINHVKLLCQNFEALEGQLSSIRGELSALTSLVKNGQAESFVPAQAEDIHLIDHPGLAEEHLRHNDRYVLRDQPHSIDRYYGPNSLFALCREFKDDPIFDQTSFDVLENIEYIRILLQQMCADASQEDQVMPCTQANICLPPRQFLTSIVRDFFKTVDYATDIFVQSSLQMHLERVYAAVQSQVDEAWAVCFNCIFLLSVGRESHNQGAPGAFQPYLQILQAATNTPRVFWAPRLVNVQALALLSYFAEQHSPPTYAAMIFGQACLLARAMGLHQSQAIPEGLSLEEIIERRKTFRSLYIRDKHLAILRGSIPCLPTYESSISLFSGRLSLDEAKYRPRIELAHIQEEVYRHLLSSAALPSHGLLSKLEDRLDRWSAVNQILAKPVALSIDSTSLVLSFLATRLCVYRGRRDTYRVSQQALRDAKASCVVLLEATAISAKLDNPPSQLHHGQSSHFPGTLQEAPNTSGHRTTASTSIALPRLVGSLPLAAVFIVAKEAAQPIGGGDDGLACPDEEIQLLEALRDRYTVLTGYDGVENHSSQMRRILDSLVRIIRLRKYPDAPTTPSYSSTSQQVSPETSPSTLQTSTPGTFMSGLTAEWDPVSASSSSSLLPVIQSLGVSDSVVSYQEQSDVAGRKGKRRRLLSETELFGMAGVLGKRPEENSFLFEFLATADISVYDADE